MKISNRNLLFCLVPLLAPLTASAETERQAERTPATSETRGSDASSTPATRNDDARSNAERQNNDARSNAETRNNDATRSDSATGTNAASWRASQVMGLNVKNAADETVGEVEDLVLDMKNGEVLAVVISSGGFLGIGESLSAVPVTALRYDGTDKTLSTSLTKEQLGQAPQFKNDAWPDYNGASANEALRSFRDSIGGDVSTRDNTRDRATQAQTERETTRDRATQAQTEREMRRDATAGGAEQGQSNEDAKISRDIRSYIADTELSRNAKNIVVTTRDEHVTLKGMVDSEEEHVAIIKIAEIHVNRANISDELVVTSE